MLKPLPLTIRRGETVNLPIRIESGVLVYATITAIAQSAPVRITATAHGMPDGWKACVMNSRGMTEMNAEYNPPRDNEFERATVVNANTVEFNTINAAGFRAYTSGGQLAYYAPLDLAGYLSARMVVKDREGGTALATFSTTDGTLEIDAANQTLWLRIADDASALLTFDSGVHDIELTDLTGETKAVCSADSVFTVLPEITT